jgi:hypothetical protein
MVNVCFPDAEIEEIRDRSMEELYEKINKRIEDFVKRSLRVSLFLDLNLSLIFLRVILLPRSLKRLISGMQI